MEKDSGSDYTAIVTGGGTGIGAAVSRMMLERGYRVIAVGLDEPGWQAEGLRFVHCDLGDEAAVTRLAADLTETGEITHIVNNAGVIRPNLIEEAATDDLRVLTNIHAVAPLILAQAALPAMKKRGFGRIIFNSSRAALGAKTRTAYSYSKSGVHGLVRTWALELGQYGITVNAVAPGPVLTDNFWGIVEKDGALQQQIAQGLPVGRIGQPEDVARAMLFFADPLNSYVTGQVLFVCGGASIASY